MSKKMFDDMAEDALSEDTAPSVDPCEELRLQNEDLEKKVLRLHADIANMQRLAAENSKKVSSDGVRRLLDQLLNPLDTLEFALSAVPADISAHPWIEGMQQYERMVQKVLTDAGLEKITITIGETIFDPQFHEAIGKVEADEQHASGSITQIYQQGYLFQGNVLRTAKVQVAD